MLVIDLDNGYCRLVIVCACAIFKANGPAGPLATAMVFKTTQSAPVKDPGCGGTDPDYKFINVLVIVCNTKGIEYCLRGYPTNSDTLFLGSK